MGMTDPIADMLTRIRNASRARHQRVAVPWSRVKENIVKVFVEEGYVKEYKKVKAAEGAGEELIVQLKFDRGQSADHHRTKACESSELEGVRRRPAVNADSQGAGYQHTLYFERNFGRSGSPTGQGWRRGSMFGMVACTR